MRAALQFNCYGIYNDKTLNYSHLDHFSGLLKFRKQSLFYHLQKLLPVQALLYSLTFEQTDYYDDDRSPWILSRVGIHSQEMIENPGFLVRFFLYS